MLRIQSTIELSPPKKEKKIRGKKDLNQQKILILEPVHQLNIWCAIFYCDCL